MSRAACPCGGRHSIRIVVEYLLRGRIEYAGGRFCYVSEAAIELHVPPEATPLRALIYDLHEPDEIIRITFPGIW